MKFDSQICTTKEQSKRLLALGLKKGTADMYWDDHYGYTVPFPIGHKCMGTPAWSLHRLLVMMPYDFTDNSNTYELGITCDGAGYDDSEDGYPIVGWWRSNTYDDIIDCIEWLIKEGYFNKEYLEE